MRRDAFTHGLWQFRSGTGNFAWAGIDMALWDICGRACGQAVVAAPRRAPAEGGDVLLLPLPRHAGEPRGSGRRRPRSRLRDLLPQGRPGRHGGSRDGLDGAGRARSGSPAPARRERNLDDSTGSAKPPSDGRATTSTSSSNPSAITRSGNLQRCARGSTRLSARTRVSGRRQTRTPASERETQMSIASLPTGSDRSAASIGFPGSHTTKGFRSASTRTASSGSRRQPAITSS